MTTLKRKVAMLAVVSAVSGVLMMFSPATPAQAVPVHDACVGAGSATLGSPLGYPLGTTAGTFSSAHSSNFTFHFNTASVCALGGPALSATGTVHGWCGLSTGTGVTSTGGTFMWVGLGGTLVVTGQIVGLVNAVPDTLAGSSCANHSASRFLVNGLGLQQSCSVVNTSVGTTVPLGGSGQPLHGSLPVSVSVCV